MPKTRHSDAEYARQLQVSGLKCFPEEQYAAAIRYYLHGLRAGLEEVTYRPKISFDDATLRLDPEARRYYAIGDSAEKPPRLMPAAIREVGDEQEQVESALAAFAEQASVRMLRIRFEEGGELCLWKKAEGKLGVHTKGLPKDVLALAVRDPSTPPAVRKALERVLAR